MSKKATRSFSGAVIHGLAEGMIVVLVIGWIIYVGLPTILAAIVGLILGLIVKQFVGFPLWFLWLPPLIAALITFVVFQRRYKSYGTTIQENKTNNTDHLL